MKGKGKVVDNGGEKCFKWTDSLTVTFLEVLRRFRHNHGYLVTFVWSQICSEFEEKTALPLSLKSTQNKYNTQKKLWTNWGKIKNFETGIGWDQETGKIVVELEWWDKKNLELGESYNTFKKKGVYVEVSDMWDDIFTDLVALGKNVVSSSMNITSTPQICVGPLKGSKTVHPHVSIEEEIERDVS